MCHSDRILDKSYRKQYGLSANSSRRLFDKVLKAIADGTRHIRIESEQ